MIYYGGFMTFLMLFDQVKNGKINFIKAAIFLPIANWPVLIGFISISFANLFNGPFLGKKNSHVYKFIIINNYYYYRFLIIQF